MSTPPLPLSELFPMPATAALIGAYTDLYLAANGDEEDRKRLGNPAWLPRPWDPPSCTTGPLRAELWAWLDTVVTWFNHEYVWDPSAGMIPSCWPLHPPLIHEIAVLADQRRRASLDLTSSSMEEWHRYCLPAFLERSKQRVKDGCTDRHQDWPAKGRYERHVAATAARTNILGNDARALTATQPAQPTEPTTKPLLRLVDEASGDRPDPGTGDTH